MQIAARFWIVLHLTGRTAVITGAASGIGLAMTRCLGREGMKVVAVDIDAEGLEKLETDQRPSGLVKTVLADVSDPEAVDKLARWIFAEFGEVGILCNNAGVGPMGTVWEVSVAEWEWVLGVNLWGVINGVRSFIPRMLASGQEGHVVNTASMAGLIVGREMTPWRLGAYAVSKHGVVALSHTLFSELRNAGAPIGVSLLCPAAVNTRIWDTERHRPFSPSIGGLIAKDSGEVARLQKQLRAGVAAGTDPAQVAEMVLEAVWADRFYVFTSAESVSQVSDHLKDLISLANPPVPES